MRLAPHVEQRRRRVAALEGRRDLLARLDKRRVLRFDREEFVEIAVLALQPRHELEEDVGQFRVELFSSK